MRAAPLILRYLSRGKLSVWQLASLCNLPLVRFTESLSSLINKRRVKTIDNGLLTIDSIPDEVADKYSLDTHFCKIDNVYEPNECSKELLARFSGATGNRPSITTEFDQGVVPPEVNLRRFLFADSNGDIRNKDILLLGDDDLLSILLALSGLPKSVTVIEVDSRINDFISDVADDMNLVSLKAHNYSAEDEIPDEFRGKFDTFFTDPVETVKGATLFLSRCGSGLKGIRNAGYFGLTRLESGNRKWLDVQKNILEMGFCITACLPMFNKYDLTGESMLNPDYEFIKTLSFEPNPPQKLWHTSSFMRLELTQEFSPAYTGNINWGRELYYDDETFVVLP